MRMMILAAAAVIGLAGLSACKPQTKDVSVEESNCPDDGPRFPGTGICQGRAANYLDPARLAGGQAPEGCMHIVNETMTPDPNEVILYHALRCKDKTTKLEFSAGARSASLGWGVSAFYEKVPQLGEEGSELVRIFTLEGVADPKAMILDMAKGAAKEAKADPAEIAACELRAAGEGFPADAFVVDVSDAYKKAKKIGPYDPVKEGAGAGVYGACGPFGITDAAGDFWLIRDGYAWFVTQGQDTPDFDAGSLTVLRKGADGAWAAAQ